MECTDALSPYTKVVTIQHPLLRATSRACQDKVLRESQQSVLWVREQRLAANNTVVTGDCRCGRKYAEQLPKVKIKFRAVMKVVCCLTPLLLVIGCGRKKKDDDQPAPAPGGEAPQLVMDEATKKWWLTKANSAVRVGQSLEELPGHERLMNLSDREAAMQLMSDDGFYDMMADFSMYWLGVKHGKIREKIYTGMQDGKPIFRLGISENVTSSSQVVHGVLGMAAGKDYFKSLFTERGPVVLNRGQPADLDQLAEPGDDPKLPQNDIRLLIQQRLTALFVKMRPLAHVEHRQEFCELVQKKLISADFNIQFSLGGPRMPGVFSDGLIDQELRNKMSTLKNWCESTSTDGVDITVLQQIQDLVAVAVPFMNQWHDKQNDTFVRHVTELKPTDLSALGRESEVELWNSSLFFKVQNSSTNRNRRRAAWILKRFFCDDLTPLNVEAPAVHASGPHGSEPACYSCHYKLDPMAGYFRELGLFGMSFAKQPFIVFDDGAIADRSTYEELWRSKAGTGREWDIGYIRSSARTDENTYGSNFKDLLELLSTAPEVKECFVKRAFEYVVGEEQTYDRSWGRELVARMNETTKVSPSLAIRGVFADLILSKSFLARERNNNVCYDLPAGTAEANRAPCRIAAILERQCTSCHNGNNRQGGLDLSTWKILADGKPGFPHNKGGTDVARTATFQEMINRLNTTDNSKRMPLMKTIPATERDELFLWLQKTASAP